MHKRHTRRRLGTQRPTSALLPAERPLDIVRLALNDVDPVTRDEDALSTLFYEFYRGYTIYSNAQGVCCIHGAGRQGCLRLQGKFVCFPDVEQAKNMIKHFQAEGRTPQESMDRCILECEYICLNVSRQRNENR